MKIVGQAASSTEALALVIRSGATMVLLDVDLGSERALDFITNARRRVFEPLRPTLLYSTYGN